MTNIWEFLLLTLTGSLAALIIIIIKALLVDKLSPRWQYGIWSLLALRLLLPVAVSGRYILAPFPLLTETLKFTVEKNLDSAYSAAFEPIGSPWFLPLINGHPVSITDWLFAVYVAGIIIFIAGSLISYIRLRLMLRRGSVPAADIQQTISQVCEKHALKACPAVELDGLTSAFVCGIFRPVLVLPAGTVTDEKVILHELLHLKHKDALQSVFWTLLRALHWCNPFMHYIFNQIGNDMEALCDQRVLEKLEGEERRDYGQILLSMVNEKYPRAAGTTSISNGGKNIAHRIECITRFKKYPRGMALVSVCIAVMLIQPMFIGTTAAGLQRADLSPSTNDDINLYSNMSALRLNRCTTMAGAIDTYVKGLVTENGLYIAAASPLSSQKELMNQMLASKADGWIYTHLENDLNGEPAQTYSDFATPFSNGYYSVYNLKRVSEGSSLHTGELAIYMEYYRHTEEEIAQGMPVYYEDPETGGWLPAVALYHITLDTEGKHWVVADCSEPEIIIAETISSVSNLAVYDALEPVAVYKGTGLHGNITAPLFTEFFVKQPESGQQNSDFGFWGTAGFNTTPYTNAQFEKVDMSYLVTYDFTGSEEALEKIYYVTLESMICDSEEDIPDGSGSLDTSGPIVSGPAINQSGGGSSSSGWGYIAESFEEGEIWNGTISDRNVNKFLTYKTEFSDYFRTDTMPEIPLPAALASKCYMPGMETDFIISREVSR